MESEIDRGSWGSRIGFILAAIGSAVGLGNIWRFPYMTAQSGGASFVILYIILLFVIGMPVMLAEFIIGRSGRKSPVQALAQPDEPNWSIIGILFVFTGFWILAYYSVVAGWTIRYTYGFLSTELMISNPGNYFGAVSAGWEAFLFHFLFMLLTTFIVIGGVEGGIERSVKVLIPLLYAIVIGLSIWAFFQKGSMEGYSYYLDFKFKRLFETYPLLGIPVRFFDLGILANAAGQTFFTLSLGMGAMITYSSYLPEENDLIEETTLISLANFGISFLAGLTVFPIIFSFDLSSQMKQSTVSTLFVALPKAFQEIGQTSGVILGFLFFLLLFMAALTSGMSLLEVVTSTLIDQLDTTRSTATALSGLAIFFMGIWPAFDTGVLSIMDTIASNVLLVTGGLFLALYVGWFMKSALDELRKGLSWNLLKPWRFLIRYVVPPVLFILLLRGIVKVF